jgi:hypothetical protein
MVVNEIQQQVRAVLEQLKGLLREQDYHSAMESNDAGEWGIAFETICAQLYEYEIRIPRAIYMRLQAIGAAMGMPAKTWQILESLID